MKRPIRNIEIWSQSNRVVVNIYKRRTPIGHPAHIELNVSKWSLQRLLVLVEGVKPSYIYATESCLAIEFDADDIRQARPQ